MQRVLLYCLLFLASAPLVSAQSRMLSFGIGVDEYQLPFLSNTSLTNYNNSKVWAKRTHFELGYDWVKANGFLMRIRGVLDRDQLPRSTRWHENQFFEGVWRFDGGMQLSLHQDIGYRKQFGGGKFGMELGVGFGLAVVVDGGSWVDGIQSTYNGDPVDEFELLKFDGTGGMIQPFIGFNYQIHPSFVISLEQRHEISAFFMQVKATRHIYDPNNGISGNPTISYWSAINTAHMLSYIPPLLRVSYVLGPCKRKGRKTLPLEQPAQ